MANSSDHDRNIARTGARAPTKRYQARRNAIVASAVAELNRAGVRGMTLGKVAARLELVPTGVIYYFRNKEELAAEAFLKAIGRFAGLIAAAETEPGFELRLGTFVRGYFEFRAAVARGEAEDIAVFNDVRALNAPLVNQAYVEMFRRARGLLGSADSLPRLHRNARAHLLLSQMFWIPAWLHASEVEDYDRAAERATSLLVHGLAAPGAAWPPSRRLSLAGQDDPKAEASSELFLRAATRLINDEGYHGASVERISAQLNVTKGAFYHHNETKDELVVACFQRTLDLMWRALREAERDAGSAFEVLALAATALVEHQMGGGAPLLRTSALTTVPPSIRTELMAKFDRLSHWIASVVSDGIADGSVRPVDVNIAAQTITGAINAAAELHFWAPGLTAQTVAEHYVRPLLYGLRSPA